jgi:branched-chain amino acid transport system permease protein
VMAESFGIDTARTKLALFVIAAGLASVSGWLYAHLVRFVNPTPFALDASITYLFMAVIGGTAQVWGAVAGAGLMTVALQWLRDLLPRLIGQPGNFEVIVFGVLLLVIMQRTGDGIADLLCRRFGRTPMQQPHDGASSGAKVVPLPTTRPAPDAAGQGGADAPLLRVEGIGKRFGGLAAVSGMSLDVHAREIVGLMGPNGAGKSTTFAMISGLLRADSGSIRLRGREISRLRPRQIVRLGVARSFQHALLLPDMSVLGNAMIGAHLRGRCGIAQAVLRLDRGEERRLRAEAEYQLSRIGLAGRLHDPAGSLPLGQQRILEIARALCAEPQLLLLDEPAAGLRHHEKQALATVLRALRDAGLGILVVEHDMDFLMNLVDRVVVMEAGSLIANGTPDAVRRDPAVLEAYLGGVDDWAA